MRTVTTPRPCTTLQLHDAQRNGQLCDLELAADGGMGITCHAIVVAVASPVVSTALQRWRRCNGTVYTFTLPMVTTSETLQCLVDLIYTGKCSVCEGALHELYRAADFLQLEEALLMELRLEMHQAPLPVRGDGFRLNICHVDGTRVVLRHLVDSATSVAELYNATARQLHIERSFVLIFAGRALRDSDTISTAGLAQAVSADRASTLGQHTRIAVALWFT